MNITQLSSAFRSHDFVQPPKDLTTVRVTITRSCWLRTAEGEPMQAVAAGSIITVQRWIADGLHADAKADLF